MGDKVKRSSRYLLIIPLIPNNTDKTCTCSHGTDDANAVIIYARALCKNGLLHSHTPFLRIPSSYITPLTPLPLPLESFCEHLLIISSSSLPTYIFFNDSLVLSCPAVTVAVFLHTSSLCRSSSTYVFSPSTYRLTTIPEHGHLLGVPTTHKVLRVRIIL